MDHIISLGSFYQSGLAIYADAKSVNLHRKRHSQIARGQAASMPTQ